LPRALVGGKVRKEREVGEGRKERKERSMGARILVRTVNTPIKKMPPRTIFFSSGILTLKTRGRGISMIMTSEDMFNAALVMRWLIIAEHCAV
jgi:hypothetical protein